MPHSIYLNNSHDARQPRAHLAHPIPHQTHTGTFSYIKCHIKHTEYHIRVATGGKSVLLK